MRLGATDPETLVVRWKQPYMLANAATVELMPPVAHQVVGDLYKQGDKQAVVNSAAESEPINRADANRLLRASDELIRAVPACTLREMLAHPYSVEQCGYSGGVTVP